MSEFLAVRGDDNDLTPTRNRSQQIQPVRKVSVSAMAGKKLSQNLYELCNLNKPEDKPKNKKGYMAGEDFQAQPIALEMIRIQEQDEEDNDSIAISSLESISEESGSRSKSSVSEASSRRSRRQQVHKQVQIVQVDPDEEDENQFKSIEKEIEFNTFKKMLVPEGEEDKTASPRRIAKRALSRRSKSTMDIKMTEQGPQVTSQSQSDLHSSIKRRTPLANSLKKAISIESKDMSDDSDENTTNNLKSHRFRSQTIIEFESSFQQKVEEIRNKLTINPASTFYQVVKLFGIWLNFITSFTYAYFAAFLGKLDEDDQEVFHTFHFIATIFFIIDLTMYILVDEHNQLAGVKERWTIKGSLKRQIKEGRLIIDIVALIPFDLIVSKITGKDAPSWLYSFKVVKLIEGFSLLDYTTYKNQLLKLQENRIKRLIQDKNKMNDQTQDHAQMSLIVLLLRLIKTFRLVILMICLSYFTGLIWYIFCLQFSNPSAEGFITVYEFDTKKNTMLSRVTALTYYTFTTLSTVGLGDYHPKTNQERILCSFIMLFGVMFTSLLMDNYSQMVQELRNFNKSHDESERFNLFLGTMKKMNGDVALPKPLVEEMEQYFRYRWQFDRMLAIQSEDDVRLFEQLPGRVQTEIYVTYLFKHFFEKFKVLFDLNQDDYEIRRIPFRRQWTLLPYHTWNLDPTKYFLRTYYDEFIVTILRLLEPIKIKDGQILQRDKHQKLTEVYFAIGGTIEVGINYKKHILQMDAKDVEIPLAKDHSEYFEIRRKAILELCNVARENVSSDFKNRYLLKLKSGNVVGFYEAAFDQESQYNFRFRENKEEAKTTNDKISCYFIRRRAWNQVQIDMDQNEGTRQLLHEFRNNIMRHYAIRVYVPFQNALKQVLADDIMKVCCEISPVIKRTQVLKCMFASASAIKPNSKTSPKASNENANKSQDTPSADKEHDQIIHSTETVMDLIKHRKLEKIRNVQQKLDLLAYNDRAHEKDAHQSKKMNMEEFKEAFQLLLKMIHQLQTDAASLARDKVIMAKELKIMKDILSNQKNEFHREKTALFRHNETLVSFTKTLKKKFEDEFTKRQETQLQLNKQSTLLKEIQSAKTAGIKSASGSQQHLSTFRKKSQFKKRGGLTAKPNQRKESQFSKFSRTPEIESESSGSGSREEEEEEDDKTSLIISESSKSPPIQNSVFKLKPKATIKEQEEEAGLDRKHLTFMSFAQKSLDLVDNAEDEQTVSEEEGQDEKAPLVDNSTQTDPPDVELLFQRKIYEFQIHPQPGRTAARHVEQQNQTTIQPQSAPMKMIAPHAQKTTSPKKTKHGIKIMNRTFQKQKSKFSRDQISNFTSVNPSEEFKVQDLPEETEGIECASPLIFDGSNLDVQSTQFDRGGFHITEDKDMDKIKPPGSSKNLTLSQLRGHLDAVRFPGPGSGRRESANQVQIPQGGSNDRNYQLSHFGQQLLKEETMVEMQSASSTPQDINMQTSPQGRKHSIYSDQVHPAFANRVQSHLKQKHSKVNHLRKVSQPSIAEPSQGKQSSNKSNRGDNQMGGRTDNGSFISEDLSQFEKAASEFASPILPQVTVDSQQIIPEEIVGQSDRQSSHHPIASQGSILHMASSMQHPSPVDK